MSDAETNSYSYEFILKRAYGIGIGNDNGLGPHMSDLRNLYWFEDPDKRRFVKHLKEKDVRDRLRKNINKGLKKVEKWKLRSDERELVDKGIEFIKAAHIADEFYAITELIHEATKRFLRQNA